MEVSVPNWGSHNARGPQNGASSKIKQLPNMKVLVHNGGPQAHTGAKCVMRIIKIGIAFLIFSSTDAIL